MSRRPAWIAAAGLAAIAVHARTAWFSFTDLDDRDLVVDDHAFLADPANLVRAFGRSYMHVVDPGHAYYRPLVTVSYGLDAQWSGLRPAGYHLTNVALHAIACVLLALVLRRFVPVAIAVVAALVFAVHPALAAAVAWIPGRNDSLLAVFSLAAWLFFLRDGARRSRVDRALHFASLTLALLTKETAFVLPLVWMAQAIAVPSPRERRRDALVYVSGWAALVAATVALHVALSGAGTVGLRTLVGNLPQLFTNLGTIIFPFAPAVLATPADLSPWPGVLAAVGLAGGTRFVPGARPRLVAFGMIAFVLTSVPVLAMPGTLVLDNRLYLPACGVLLAGAEIVRAAMFERPQPVSPGLFAALASVGVLFLGLLTAGYEPSFRDPRAFARAAVEGPPVRRSPTSASARRTRPAAKTTARWPSTRRPWRSDRARSFTTTSRSSTWPTPGGRMPSESSAKSSPAIHAMPGPTTTSRSCSATRVVRRKQKWPWRPRERSNRSEGATLLARSPGKIRSLPVGARIARHGGPGCCPGQSRLLDMEVRVAARGSPDCSTWRSELLPL